MALGTLWSLRASPWRKFLTRAFTATPCLHRVMEPLPVFTPSSNPELDEVLKAFRETQVIPRHLALFDRNRVFRKKYRSQLRMDRPEVVISDELITLKPIIEPVRPFGRRDVIKVLNQMVTPEDLSNLPPFLLGLKQIECPLTDGQKQKIARTCSLKGRIDTLMTIARQAKWYGYHFTKQSARECMRGLLVEQSMPGERNAATRALKHADELMVAFAKSGAKVDPNMRLKRDPVIIGTALSMFADTSLNYSKGVDVKGRTMELCVFLKDKCWQDVEWDQETPETPPDMYAKSHAGRVAVHKVKEAILDYTAVLEGLLGAKSLLKNTEVENWLEDESQKLAEKIAGWDAYVKENITRLKGGEEADRMGLHLYRKTALEIQARERDAQEARLQALKLEAQGKGEQKPENSLEDDDLTQEEREELEALEKGM